MAVHWTLGGDALDPQVLATFWAVAFGDEPETGYEDPGGASIVDQSGTGSAIGWLRVPEGKSAKNRLHIDIRVTGDSPADPATRERLVREKVAQLVSLGARVVREERYGMDFGHVVMLDPEDNEFCVA